MEPAQHDEQLSTLNERIVPGAKASRGFVAGYWMLDADSGKSHSTTVCANEASALEFKAAVEQSAQHAAHSGVTNDTLITALVLASA